MVETGHVWGAKGHSFHRRMIKHQLRSLRSNGVICWMKEKVFFLFRSLLCKVSERTPLKDPTMGRVEGHTAQEPSLKAVPYDLPCAETDLPNQVPMNFCQVLP